MMEGGKYDSLRDFIRQLEAEGELKRVGLEVDPCLELTEICCRTLQAGGPALLFTKPKGSSIPVLGNLFGTTKRVAMAMGVDSIKKLRDVGRILAFLKAPEMPQGLGDMMEKLPAFKKLMDVNPRIVNNAPCRQHSLQGSKVDLSALPIQTCWPEDAGPLITWGLVITRGPYKKRQNIGVYRQQVIAPNKVIMRWLPHRGGAGDYREWQEANPGQRFPVAVALGADPATILAAVTPIPDTLSEYQFAGLLRGARSEVVTSQTIPLQVPASAEIVLEGHIYPDEEAL